MSEPKFTPGPWNIGTPPPNNEQTIGTKDGMMIAVVTTGVNMVGATLANAHLIAAAPDLYRELEIAASVFRKYEVHHLAKDDLLKAKSNRELAEQMETALKRLEDADL